MSSTFSPNLNLQYQGTGDNVNTWGSLLNTAVFANIDQALGGPFTVSVAGSSDYTLSAANALNLYHAPTGILTGSISYIFPASCGRIVIVNNATTGAYTLTVKSSGGTGVVVPQGSIAWVFINSTGNVASIPFGVTTEASIASATTTDLGSTGSNTVKVTGTTTITALGSSASTVRPIYIVKFSGILTLTHNGTSLILPGATNITTAANDCFIFEYLGSGNWLCMFKPSSASAGDFSSNTATSVDSEVVLFSGTGGKTGKRATLTATVVKSASGILSAASAGTDYYAPGSTDVAVADGGTGLSTLTANNLILGNGASAPNFLAPSTSGNVATSNGTTWTSAAPSAVPTATPTTIGVSSSIVVTVDFTTYSAYRLIVQDLGMGGSTHSWGVNVSSDGGSNYAAETIQSKKFASTTFATSTSIQMQSSASGILSNAECIITQATTGGAARMFFNGGEDVTNLWTGEVNYATSAAINRIRLSSTGDNFNSGYYTIVPISRR